MNDDAIEAGQRNVADRNRATVLRLMRAMDICDADTIREIIAPTATWWVLGVGVLDRENVIQQLQHLLGNAQVAETHIIGTTAEDDRVAVEARGNFVFADGRAYRNHYHHLYTLSADRVIGVREYLDLRETERIFGPTGG
ncbi:nuclear transport factor 2 family protein [Sphingomonas oryzagri]